MVNPGLLHETTYKQATVDLHQVGPSMLEVGRIYSELNDKSVLELFVTPNCDWTYFEGIGHSELFYSLKPAMAHIMESMESNHLLLLITGLYLHYEHYKSGRLDMLNDIGQMTIQLLQDNTVLIREKVAALTILSLLYKPTINSESWYQFNCLRLAYSLRVHDHKLYMPSLPYVMIRLAGCGGDTGDSIALLRKSIQITINSMGKGVCEYSSAKHGLAIVHVDNGDVSDEVAAEMREAVEWNRRINGSDHPDCAQTELNAAFVVHSLGTKRCAEHKYEESIRLYEEAKMFASNSYKAFVDEYGENIGHSVSALVQLGAIQNDLGEYDEGISKLEHANQLLICQSPPFFYEDYMTNDAKLKLELGKQKKELFGEQIAIVKEKMRLASEKNNPHERGKAYLNIAHKLSRQPKLFYIMTTIMVDCICLGIESSLLCINHDHTHEMTEMIEIADYCIEVYHLCSKK